MKPFVQASLFPVLMGLVLAEVLVPAEMRLLLLEHGPMALVGAETLNIFLLDFPLSLLAGALYARKHPEAGPGRAVAAGAVFLAVFLLVMLGTGALHGLLPFSRMHAWTGIAIERARHVLGFRLHLILLQLLALDLGVCVLGASAGRLIARALPRKNFPEPSIKD